MKISYNILKNFVEPPHVFSAKELAEVLTMHTVEVDEAVDLKEKLRGVVVGVVTAIKPHPKADKLKLATVDIGKKNLEVVCGGVNLQEGMKVALAQVGTQVRWHGETNWTSLEKTTIRGVESAGMICAAEELEIYDPQAVKYGIMDLSDNEAEPGTPLSQALGLDDIILNIDNKSITHRPDLWGHFGLARELSAIWQKPLKNPENIPIQNSRDIKLQVKIAEPDYCQRYLGIVLAGLRIFPSPLWLQRKLLSLGMRPINNIVDVTNYVMLEYGQPLHAFDLAKLVSPEIMVRLVKRGEKIITIDGVERKLDQSMLVIADNKQPQAIAGVMGGIASEVNDNTEAVIIESATFNAISTRQTASRLGLRTEASARFEKGLDPELAYLAIRRAVELICQIMPEAKIASQLVDEYPRVAKKIIIDLNLSWLEKRLGCQIPEGEVMNILQRLGFGVAGSSPNIKVTVPSWRAGGDITRPEDLIEEVARIYGYHKILPVLPKFVITPPPKDKEQELRWRIRELLIGAGWTETLSYSFVSGENEKLLRLENPVDKTKPYLRQNLISSMAEQFESAQKAGRESIKMFELGRVFLPSSGKMLAAGNSKEYLPDQPWHLLLAIYDKKAPVFRILKGVVEFIEQQTGTSFKPKYEQLNGGWLAEIELEGVETIDTVKYNPLPKFPAVIRDLSLIIPQGVLWSEIFAEISKISPLIENIQVFDVYEERGSISFSIVFRSAERTLASSEVEAVMDDIVKSLQDKFKASIR